MSWGNGGGRALPVDSMHLTRKGAKKKAAAKQGSAGIGMWTRKVVSTREDQLAGREPFRCNEPDHDERRKALPEWDRRPREWDRRPRVRWLAVVGIMERDEAWPECCDQVMELLPSDEANRLRDRVSAKRAAARRPAPDDEGQRDDAGLNAELAAAAEEFLEGMGERVAAES